MNLDKNIVREIVEQLKNELIPIGSILIYSSEKVPHGYLPCDGSELSKKAYPELYALIGGTWGETKDSFFLPDLQGQFVRGWDKDGDIDPDRKFGKLQADAFQGHGHKLLIEGKISEDGSHRHLLYFQKNTIEYGNNTFSVDHSALLVRNFESRSSYYDNKYGKYKTLWPEDYDSYSVDNSGSHTHTLPSMSITDPESCANGLVYPQNETRPKNMALMFCIKVK